MPIYEFKCEDCNEEFEALVFEATKPSPAPAAR